MPSTVPGTEQVISKYLWDECLIHKPLLYCIYRIINPPSDHVSDNKGDPTGVPINRLASFLLPSVLENQLKPGHVLSTFCTKDGVMGVFVSGMLRWIRLIPLAFVLKMTFPLTASPDFTMEKRPGRSVRVSDLLSWQLWFSFITPLPFDHK